MANQQTSPDEKMLLVEPGLDPRLACVLVPNQHPGSLKGWEYRDLLAERLHRLIQEDPNAENRLRQFLESDPEEPLDLLDRPRRQWASGLLRLSPLVQSALGDYGLQRARELQRLRPLNREVDLGEWLALVRDAQR